MKFGHNGTCADINACFFLSNLFNAFLKCMIETYNNTLKLLLCLFAKIRMVIGDAGEL